MPEVGLRYVGDGSEGTWIPGHPAADHNETDHDLRLTKIHTGLYARGPKVPEPPEPEPAPPAPESEPAPPAPRPPYWFEEVTPESVAKARALLAAAEAPAEPAAPEEAGDLVAADEEPVEQAAEATSAAADPDGGVAPAEPTAAPEPTAGDQGDESGASRRLGLRPTPDSLAPDHGPEGG